MSKLRTLFIALSLVGCSANIDEAADPANECATCAGGKTDGLTAPDEGSCEAGIIVRFANEASFEELDIDARLNARAAQNIVDARDIAAFQTLADVDSVSYVGAASLQSILEFGMESGASCDDAIGCDVDVVVTVANEATFEQLDDDMGLDRRAAQGIVDGRPFGSVNEVDAVSYVGPSALEDMRAFGETAGFACTTPQTDDALGIISDLDKTVIPPSSNDLSVAPYPGVVTLYDILRDGSDRLAYVTARSPDRVVDIPDYLERYGLPSGPIETGVMGQFWRAQEEKVMDISRHFDANPARPYVLFGDTSHRDPEVYREILATYPDRVQAGLIHMVNRNITMSRVDGLHLFHNHAEAAAILAGLEIITESEAREVFQAARDEGLDLDQADFEDLLDANGI